MRMWWMICVVAVAVAFCFASEADAGSRRVLLVQQNRCNDAGVLRVQRNRVQRVQVIERVQVVDRNRGRNVQLGLFNFNR